MIAKCKQVIDYWIINSVTVWWCLVMTDLVLLLIFRTNYPAIISKSMLVFSWITVGMVIVCKRLAHDLIIKGVNNDD